MDKIEIEDIRKINITADDVIVIRGCYSMDHIQKILMQFKSAGVDGGKVVFLPADTKIDCVSVAIVDSI